ncbi:hypothetical protein, partial [Streptococcus pseudopneumoniae]|uniref:hypothetical protein n=1 Tax=Streptococcus pseudopneumoniae TaxID=257758 RepID=UPI0019D686F9
GFSPIDPSQQVRCYRLSAAGGVVSDSYVSIDESNLSHVFDPALSPVEGLAIASSPAWALPAGTPHICIPYVAYGQTYDLD